MSYAYSSTLFYSFKITCKIHIETKSNKNHIAIERISFFFAKDRKDQFCGEEMTVRETVVVWIPTVSQLLVWKYEASGISVVALG